jgi:hypothetical protein
MSPPPPGPNASQFRLLVWKMCRHRLCPVEFVFTTAARARSQFPPELLPRAMPVFDRVGGRPDFGMKSMAAFYWRRSMVTA